MLQLDKRLPITLATAKCSVNPKNMSRGLASLPQHALNFPHHRSSKALQLHVFYRRVTKVPIYYNDAKISIDILLFLFIYIQTVWNVDFIQHAHTSEQGYSTIRTCWPFLIQSNHAL